MVQDDLDVLEFLNSRKGKSSTSAFIKEIIRKEMRSSDCEVLTEEMKKAIQQYIHENYQGLVVSASENNGINQDDEFASDLDYMLESFNI
jgi:metal-responsive CopG/Arc/MetJ family transcriptional regulator